MMSNNINIPPQVPEMEQAVLGAMLMDKNCIDPVLAILKPESFYRDEHRKIFSSIQRLYKASKAIDLLTVTEELRRNKQLDEVGGPVFVTRLTSLVASGSHAEKHAAIIQDKYLSREIIRIATEAQVKAYEQVEDIVDIFGSIQDSISILLSDNQSGTPEPIKKLVAERMREIEENTNNKNEISGISSGLHKLDRVTGGWQKQDLIILAARPSQGKTALGLSFALHAGMKGYKVVFFSMEMSKARITDRALSSLTEVSPLSLRTGRIADHEWELLDYKGVKTLENTNLFIDDTPALSLIKLKSKLLQIRKHKIDLVIVDYLQLMKGTGNNREQEISSISRGLKALAKELNIPVIALSQLNREADGKRPVLSNLRESGAIEQDADIVLFIHRPDDSNLMELIISKHRNGPTGLVECFTNDFCTRFMDELPGSVPEAMNYIEPNKPF